MPSTPGFPAERPTAQRPAANREVESFESAESGAITLAASTVFQEVITFGGRPDSIIIDASAAAIEVRFRNRGEAARAPIRVQGAGERRYQIMAEIVEARDPAGAGGQLVTATGRWASRAIDVRSNNPGPSRERPMLPASELAYQVDQPE
jgi:hypothetical protein